MHDRVVDYGLDLGSDDANDSGRTDCIAKSTAEAVVDVMGRSGCRLPSLLRRRLGRLPTRTVDPEDWRCGSGRAVASHAGRDLLRSRPVALRWNGPETGGVSPRAAGPARPPMPDPPAISGPECSGREHMGSVVSKI